MRIVLFTLLFCSFSIACATKTEIDKRAKGSQSVYLNDKKLVLCYEGNYSQDDVSNWRSDLTTEEGVCSNSHDNKQSSALCVNIKNPEPQSLVRVIYYGSANVPAEFTALCKKLKGVVLSR